MVKMDAKSSEKGNNLIITPEAFNAMVRLRDEFDSIIETIEIMNDKELMEGIKRSKDDVEAGKIHELKNVDDLDKIWSNAD
jgi:PHD/YefM family antitoxin component YafN of YafNO toxin-antitoxin module